MAKQTITLTNLLTNPSFESTGWTANSACSVSYSTSPKHSGSYSLKVTSTSSSESLIVTSDTYAIRKNHIYYISVYFYETVNVCSEMQCYWPIAEPLVGIAKVDKTKLNQWQRLSWRNVRSNWNDNQTAQFRFDFEGMASNTMAYIDDAMLIDLTAAFGAGNEPTQSWCDTNIEYFAGNTTIQYEAPMVYDLTSTTPTKIKTGDILNCPYSGSAKSITLPKGQYKLECWGAQGGNYRSYGGYGGYSTGILTLSNKTIIYLQTGGKGSDSSVNGGYNGGGKGINEGRGGGGASDIRIGQNSLYARVIVAGAGGGSGVANDCSGKGAGGGTSGLDGYSNGVTSSGGNRSGSGGSQTAGGISMSSIASTRGSFGQGGPAYQYSCGGGGGGWYGGGGAYDNDGDADGRNGGGGSGYVYTSSTASNYPSGCLLNSSYYLTNAQTIAGNTAFTSPTGTNETGHTGNGYIRITVIEASSGNTLVKTTSNTWKEPVQMFINTGISTTIPSGLVELEYIESTGTQYIETGISAKNITKAVIDFQYITVDSSRENQMMSVWVDASNHMQCGLTGTTFLTGRGTTFSQTSNMTARTIGTSVPIGNPDMLIPLFAQRASAVDRWSIAKLYSCKMYNNSTLVRDFVPVKRISDNVYGLWDKVNEVLYENAGTGAFIGGPTVNLTGWHKIKGAWVKTAADTWSQAL